MRILKIFLVSIFILSGLGCAFLPSKNNDLSDSIVGDYEVISYETTECGKYGPMPMVGEVYFGEDWKYSIRMRPSWTNVSEDIPFWELDGLFYVGPHNELSFYVREKDIEKGGWLKEVGRYRVENWPDGRYLVIIMKVSKSEAEYQISMLRGRRDKEAEILRNKYLYGFEWKLKKK